MRLGQEFGAYAQAVAFDRERIATAGDRLRRLGIGGTATGTGLNAHPEFHTRMLERINQLTGFQVRSSANLFESMQSLADPLDFSAALNTLAITLTRIANDLRNDACVRLHVGAEPLLLRIAAGPVGAHRARPAPAEALEKFCQPRAPLIFWRDSSFKARPATGTTRPA